MEGQRGGVRQWKVRAGGWEGRVEPDGRGGGKTEKCGRVEGFVRWGGRREYERERGEYREREAKRQGE